MGPALAPDDYPDPVCAVRLAGEAVVLAERNEAFTTRIPLSHGADLADAFDVEPSGPALAKRIADGGSFLLHREAESYAVRAIPSPDTRATLVFVELPRAGRVGVGDLASVLSHDLRNPLDVAKARLDAARELDEDVHFDHVARAHDRMERIIRDVLTLARGEDVIDPDAAVDLGEIARTAWQNVATEAGTLEFTGELPHIRADPDRTKRLFENLFRNAIEHGTEDGGVHVRVGPLDDGRGFFVADDGTGIPPEDRERIFAPGYSGEEHGTGLGLAIVSRIADVHGWSIAVCESATGGARFDIRGFQEPEGGT